MGMTTRISRDITVYRRVYLSSKAISGAEFGVDDILLCLLSPGSTTGGEGAGTCLSFLSLWFPCLLSILQFFHKPITSTTGPRFRVRRPLLLPNRVNFRGVLHFPPYTHLAVFPPLFPHHCRRYIHPHGFLPHTSTKI